MITPYLYYEDVADALDWLAAAFGFKEMMRMPGPGGKVRHAAMKFGDAVVMMGHPGPEYKSPKRLGQSTQCLYVNVDDVEKHFARAKKAGAKIIQGLEDKEYGDRTYGAEDPEGHVWYFAQRIAKGGKPKRAKKRGGK